MTQEQSKFTHTPGPWLLDDPRNARVHSKDYHTIDADAGFHPRGFHISTFLSLADARLIAAAPELLEALRDVLGWVPGGLWHTDAPMKAVERARAAIAKATGAEA